VTEVPVFCSECERKGKAVELCVIREYWYNALMQKCPKEQGQAVTLGGIESGASRREAESTPTPENLSADKAVTSTPAQRHTSTRKIRHTQIREKRAIIIPKRLLSTLTL